MSEPTIIRVKDNKDKQRTYAYWKNRYKVAVKDQFYFEGIMIDYALIEDRLTSILFHSGVMPNRQTLNMTAKSTKKQLHRIIQAPFGDYKENEPVRLKNISGKIRVIRAILIWANTNSDDCDKDRYLSALKRQYESIDAEEMLDVLKQLDSWCDYRNELVHATLNKNLESLSENLAERTVEGFNIACYLDNKERIIKKGNHIRKAANLGVN